MTQATSEDPSGSSAALRLPYSVHFAAEIDAPADLLLRALEVLLEIAASMESISPTSAFGSEAHSANAELTRGDGGSSTACTIAIAVFSLLARGSLVRKLGLHEHGPDLSRTGYAQNSYCQRRIVHRHRECYAPGRGLQRARASLE